MSLRLRLGGWGGKMPGWNGCWVFVGGSIDTKLWWWSLMMIIIYRNIVIIENLWLYFKIIYIFGLWFWWWWREIRCRPPQGDLEVADSTSTLETPRRMCEIALWQRGYVLCSLGYIWFTYGLNMVVIEMFCFYVEYCFSSFYLQYDTIYNSQRSFSWTQLVFSIPVSFLRCQTSIFDQSKSTLNRGQRLPCLVGHIARWNGVWVGGSFRWKDDYRPVQSRIWVELSIPWMRPSSLSLEKEEIF